jgi:hypothetical protein
LDHAVHKDLKEILDHKDLAVLKVQRDTLVFKDLKVTLDPLAL